MVLLVVDTQKAIVNAGLYNFEIFKTSVKELIKQARTYNVEVIYVRHDDGAGTELTKGADGFEIYEEFCPAIGEKVFDKKVNSPFRDTGLLEYLHKKGEKVIVVAGLQTDYCIDATIKCGFEHGFQVIVPEYANTTFDNDFMSADKTYEYYNHFMWNKRYAKCVSVEETIEMMKKLIF